jgi:hypothetical protein
MSAYTARALSDFHLRQAAPPALTVGVDSTAMDLQLAAGAIFVVGEFGVVAWGYPA